jgi:protein-S-isoprenylcysteine O-methyltransferase Ste14
LKAGYLLFTGLYFLGMATRAIYEQLKKKDRINPENKITFAIVFLAMCLMWASWFNLCPLDPLQIALPQTARWIGFGIFLAGLGLAIGAVIQLRGVENIDHLVTNGLFSKLRHPMYLGFIFWVIGWVIYHGAVLSLFLGLIAIGNIIYWQRSEESELKSKYGETYLRYKKNKWF